MTEPSVEPVLDHVVLAARDRAAIEEALAALGLRAGSGRAIPGAGLSNVMVAVGSQLLELHYPDGSPVAEGAPPYAQAQRAALAAHPDVPLVPVAWVVRYPSEAELRAASARVGYPVVEVPAEPPNEAPHLLGGLGAAFERPWLPALIHWSAAPHLPPTLVEDRGRGPNEGRLTLDVSGPADELRAWCGALPRRVEIGAGTAGPLRAWLRRPDGTSAALGLPPE
ncbi:VOC family protein [Streptomyces sp. DSM 44915]|uniref:VOC family protein n=1 Tax=Streptomyces chisholmiae TaxID=3075540 RepID=A0ABU2JVL4_9ACTN|nr:VOC family protein [Streptomyces sp. DSM 44915]MDT0269022.1 VOC family protein [Streptomyces sp. DSM 44915]